MINLLPTEVKTSYQYGRRNVGLRRWVIAFAVAFIGLGIIATYGLLTLKQQNTHYENQVATTQALFKQEKFSQTQSQVKQISSDFKLVVQVLDKEVLFSGLIKQLATILPNNANLTGLTINKSQGALDVTANTIDYNTATQVQINLSDPANKLFSKADIISINCTSNNSGSTAVKYPCTVTIKALFIANNPYLFINNTKTVAKP